MKVVKNDIVSAEVFGSVLEFVNTINKRTPNKAFLEAGVKASETGSVDFTGTNNFEEAQKLMKCGYKEGAQDLLLCKSGVNVISPEQKKQTFQDVTGFAPIVPNAIIGLPNSMLNKRMQQKQAKVINILLDIDICGGTDKNVILLGGKNIYSLIKSIEATGTKVNLSVISSSYLTKNKKFSCVFIKVKDSKQAINPQLVAYPVIHPSFFRRHVFRWIETSELTNYKSFTSGYGYVGRDYMAQKSGSVMRFLTDNKLADKNTFYIDIIKASKAKDLKELKQFLGVE